MVFAYNFPQSVLETAWNKMIPTDWVLLSQAFQFYQKIGYQYCEVPYLLPEGYTHLTKPHNDRSYILQDSLFSQQNQELVGSAEQSFIYLMVNKQLPNHKLCAITPCFRTDNYNNTHFPWFMKCELFQLSDNIEDCQWMIYDAFTFYSTVAPYSQLEVIQTGHESWDINYNGIEIASFGLRRFNFGTFIYGTGLALPRFTIAQNTAEL